MTTIDTHRRTSEDIAEDSGISGWRFDIKVDVKGYNELSKEAKAVVKGNIVGWYLKNRDNQNVDDFIKGYEGKIFTAKDELHRYNISSDVVKHVITNLERNLANKYAMAVINNPRTIENVGRENMYSITKDKVEDVRSRWPDRAFKGELSLESMAQEYKIKTALPVKNAPSAPKRSLGSRLKTYFFG